MGQSGERSTCHERKPAPLWLQGRGWEDRREDCTCSFGERAKMNTWVSPPPGGLAQQATGYVTVTLWDHWWPSKGRSWADSA